MESEAFARLARDGRFASEQLRQDNDELLPTELGKIFGEQTAREWEEMLLPRGGPCVEVTETVSHEYMQSQEFGRASGFVIDVEHPTFGSHPRLTPFLHFSRSATRAGRGCLLGEHTDSILAELGHGAEEIKTWRDKAVIG